MELNNSPEEMASESVKNYCPTTSYYYLHQLFSSFPNFSPSFRLGGSWELASDLRSLYENMGYFRIHVRNLENAL